MTQDEWDGAVAPLLGNWWPGEWTPMKSSAYRTAVGHFSMAQVTGALEQILRSGQKFRPSAGEVYVTVTGTVAPPASPEEAWALITEAVRRVGRASVATDFQECHQAAIDWLATQDRVVAAYATRKGLTGRPGTLGMEQVNDPQFGGAALHRLHGEYRDHVEQVQSRIERGLPAVTDEMLRLPERSSGGLAEMLDRLRPEAQHAIEAGTDA